MNGLRKFLGWTRTPMSCSRYSNDAASGGMVKQVQVVVAVVVEVVVAAAVVAFWRHSKS